MSQPMARRVALTLLAALLLAGCRQGMFYDQPVQRREKYNELRDSGQWVTHPGPGTVALGQEDVDSPLASGAGRDGNLLETPPMAVTDALMARGRERFDIYCAPCHGRTGYGDGMIVQRGFPHPPSYHTDHLRGMPLGHFVRVMQRGQGVMSSYADRVSGEDRWAIACYVRALQLAEHARAGRLPNADRTLLERAPVEPPPGENQGVGARLETGTIGGPR